MTDAELVARARQGDSAAFGELVDRHRTAVFRAALAVLGSHAEADEAAQDAFVAAWRRLGSFRGEASFKTWLLAIAWRHAITRRRTLVRWWRRIAGSRDDGSNPGDDVASPDASPEQTAAAAEERRAIVQEIKALPAKLRDVLLLAQSGEYRYEDIAAIVGAPVGTIKWRVSEARRVVRKRMHERGYADV